MKNHIRSLKANTQPICGVAITDASLQFLDKKDRLNRLVLGQSSTCRRCANKVLKVLDHKGQSIVEYLTTKKDKS